jgi:outer membrane protein OmpA-like peptidoglycan-associated protein
VPTGEVVRWRATAVDPDGDVLRYTWTISAGRMTGEGSEVSSETTGLVIPVTLTATVAVDDGRGGGAQARCQARVEAAKQPARTVTCVSAGFPRNLSRLNNVDKACLDDVAARMRQDPRSTLLIKGHAEAGERFPEVLARKRAEAAKDYLVTERAIEASRIVTRGVIDGVPGAPARAGANRRVEVIFAPEDAPLPEQ